VEALDAIGWPDLSSEKRTRVVQGALDAFDREGSAIVRALAARLLSLAALHDPASIVPELKRRAAAWQNLLAEAAPDHPVASLAFAAQAGWFMVDPETAPWAEPPPSEWDAVIGALYRARAYPAVRLSARHQNLRPIIRLGLDASDAQVRLAAVEMLNWLGPEVEDVALLAARLGDEQSSVQAAAVACLVAPGTPGWMLGAAFVSSRFVSPRA
jgi:hypothetical protein